MRKVKKKKQSNIFGFIIIFLITIFCANTVTLFHSDDYQQKNEEYNTTNNTYDTKETEDTFKEDNQDNNNSNEDEKDKELIVDDNKEESNKIKIHYLDVGQGDSIFIELPNNSTMLIDAGESSKGLIVANYIKKLNYSKIDYLVGTHPHTDHIGGLSYIINNFDIGKIYMPKALSTTKTYENLLNTISSKGLKITTAKAGVNIIDEDNLKVDIIAPNKDSYNDLNNYSAVIKITYQQKKFLFMGDAEIESENEITTDVSADVIKIGHHGSDTSSGKSFVDKVNAKYAIIMVGNNNKYNHPYQTIIDRWTSTGTTIYRTDLNGTIVLTSDGNTIDIKPSK